MKNGLHTLFLEELSDIQNAEKQLTKALPKMATAAEDGELRDAFLAHLRQTEDHISRLNQVFASLGESPQRKKCKGMEGVIDEGTETMKEHEGEPEGDAALIAAAQKAEHYEIATYGCLCTWAQTMGHEEALELLEETLAEEKEADAKLTGIAESLANRKATESVSG
jgi:ferritin-like metal-binding protein YciE